ncbi:hypothetical protein SAMN04488122_0895 [Chitinophaga arvensicola]|uniref:Uncharacterized protein n=1 Tax=Chitinophaga arvensicola TaxID=29529 RepID=A0A1I0PP86_9BACT|nr:hypothetical protein SAMN04488122_0895 [Chitinophaga arvensicola]
MEGKFYTEVKLRCFKKNPGTKRCQGEFRYTSNDVNTIYLIVIS